MAKKKTAKRWRQETMLTDENGTNRLTIMAVEMIDGRYRTSVTHHAGNSTKRAMKSEFWPTLEGADVRQRALVSIATKLGWTVKCGALGLSTIWGEKIAADLWPHNVWGESIAAEFWPQKKVV